MPQRILDVDDLEPGYELARPITKNGNVLFPEGRRLSERDIRSLVRWKIQTATIKKETLNGDGVRSEPSFGT